MLKASVQRKINRIGRNSREGCVISILRPSESMEPQSITSSPSVRPIKENAEIFIIISAQDRHRKCTSGRMMFGRIWTNSTRLREAPEETDGVIRLTGLSEKDIGEFVQARITGAEVYDLIGEKL